MAGAWFTSVHRTKRPEQVLRPSAFTIMQERQSAPRNRLLLVASVDALPGLLAVEHVGPALARALALGFLALLLLALLLGNLVRDVIAGHLRVRADERCCLQLRQRRESYGNRQRQNSNQGLPD